MFVAEEAFVVSQIQELSGLGHQESQDRVFWTVENGE